MSGKAQDQGEKQAAAGAPPAPQADRPDALASEEVEGGRGEVTRAIAGAL